MYLDTCIIVKLLVPEPDSASLEEALVGRSLVTSELAVTEVTSALFARERAGALGPRHRDQALRQFHRWLDEEEIVLLPLDRHVLDHAARLIGRCHSHVALRSLDAVHLATADLSRETPLWTTDLQLRQAANRIGLEVFPLT